MLESHCYSLPFQPKFAQLPWPKNAFLNWTSQTHQVCIQSQLSDYTPLQKLCLFEATQWKIKRWPRDCSWFSPKLHQSPPPSRARKPLQSPYLSALDFCNPPVWNIKFDELDFFLSLNWIFLPAVACKIQVWNRLKIKLIKLDITNWRIAKIKCR